MWILDLPYTLIFDRITPMAVKWAIYTRSYEVGNTFCRNAKWKDYFFDSCGKKVVVLGIAGAFWTVANQEAGMIYCGIDWSGKYSGKKVCGIPVYSPDVLEDLAKDDNYSYLILADSWIRVQTAVDLLSEYGIHKYYSYVCMECRNPKYILSKVAYRFLRIRDYLLHRDGFIQNIIIFYFKMFLRRIWPRFGRISYRRIKALKNRHKGQRCFIVATGPSLTISDIELLKDEITFGVNGIYKLFSETDWRPTYYTMVDYKVFLDQCEKGNELDFSQFCQREFFITDKICSLAGGKAENERTISLLISYLDHMVFGEHFHFKYRKNISVGMYNAGTVVNSCINIAHYMGFSEIYLLGTDCNYKLPKQYFDDSQNWLATDLDHATMINSFMQSGYAYYKRKMDQYGVNVLNATRGGMLEVFPRVALEDVLAEVPIEYAQDK